MENKFLIELAYSKLIYNTRKGFGSTRKQRASSVNLTNTIFIPLPKTDELQVQSESRTVNDSYKSIIIFTNIIFRDEPSTQTATVVGVDGEEYHFTKINKNRSNVKVNCSCLDFNYRFASFNHRDGALAGDPPDPYIRKKGSNRGPVNPKKVSGLCKHLQRMGEELEREGIFF